MSLSVSTCLTELNEITVIQLDQSEEEIQILFSSSPVSDSHIYFLSPLSRMDYCLSSPFRSFALIYIQTQVVMGEMQSVICHHIDRSHFGIEY